MVKFSGDSLIPCWAKCLLRFSADSSDHPEVFRIEPISGLAPTDFRHRGVILKVEIPPYILKKAIIPHIRRFFFFILLSLFSEEARVEGRCCHGEDSQAAILALPWHGLFTTLDRSFLFLVIPSFSLSYLIFPWHLSLLLLGLILPSKRSSLLPQILRRLIIPF